MPITFEPRQAFDQKTIEAYGAALARQQDREFALRASAQAQAAADRSSALAQNDEHFRDSQGQQVALEQIREGNQMQLAQAGMANQQSLQNQRIQAEFTQADNLRLERLNQDAAGWESLYNAGEIDDEEYKQGQQQLNRGRMPLMARRQAAEETRLQRQYELFSKQAAHQTAIARQNERFLNSDGPIYHTDKESGQRFFMSGINGQWTPVPEPRPQGRDRTALTPETMNQIHDHIERQVDTLVNAPNFAVPSSFPNVPGETPEARKARYREHEIQRRVADRTGRLTGEGNPATLVAPFDAMQTQIMQNPAMQNQQGMRVLAGIAEGRQLFLQAHGNVNSLPPEALARYRELERQFREATEVAPPPRDTRTGINAVSLGDLTQYASPP